MEKTNISKNMKDKVPATIQQLLESDAFRKQVARMFPQHLKADRFIRVAITTMNRTPKLAQCDQASFFNALLTLSQLGLEPDGRRAHLIPYENRKKGIVECQLIVDYKGIVELISNAGDVTNIHADIVCENDQFVYDRGVLVKHEIEFKKPRGAMYAAYTLFRFKDGTEKVEVMSKEEIDKIRARSRASDSGPWVTDYNEMAKKTTLRRASKWVKLLPEQRDVIERDDTNFTTDAFEVSPSKESTVQEIGLDSPRPEQEQPKKINSEETAPIDPRKALKKLLGDVCEGDFMAMGQTLKTVSLRQEGDNKGWLSMDKLDKAPIAWVEDAYGKLLDRTKK